MDSAVAKTASPVTVGDVDYFYVGKVRSAIKPVLEQGEKVPVWIQGADYWGEVNGQGFIIRSTDESAAPRMVPPALADSYNNGRKQDIEAQRAIDRLRRQANPQNLAEIPTYVR